MNHIVNTPCGSLRGTDGKLPGTAAFKGIRYATAGRWEYPTVVTSWEGLYDATAYGPSCYQPMAFHDESSDPEKKFYYREFRKDIPYRFSEDCLFLNVFAPGVVKKGEKLPVIVYIHGGSFTSGSSQELPFMEPVWPVKKVIGVTINYRLGPLGFLCLPQLKEEAGHTGNYGLYDQIAALQWVRNNIASFGGDPENVTVMGQSAGAMSVQQLVLSPMAEGLFHKAVMCSGAGVHQKLSAQPPESQYPFWNRTMELSGCSDLASFRALSVEKLFTAWDFTRTEKKGVCAPCLDGQLIVGTGEALLKQEKQMKIPYLAGTTSEDMMGPILYSMAASWIKAQKTKSWLWYFNRQLPGDSSGAWHSSDLWYWFGTLPNGWRPWEKKDQLLSQQMVDYLVHFARTGDPNGVRLPEWEPGGSKALFLGEGRTRMAKPSTLKQTFTMLTRKGVGR